MFVAATIGAACADSAPASQQDTVAGPTPDSFRVAVETSRGKFVVAVNRAWAPRGANRFYELVNVYGTTFKELIHEEFGDGIMSAIDFKMDLTREPDPKGDRVKIMMSGKYLQYKTY